MQLFFIVLMGHSCLYKFVVKYNFTIIFLKIQAEITVKMHVLLLHKIIKLLV